MSHPTDDHDVEDFFASLDQFGEDMTKKVTEAVDQMDLGRIFDKHLSQASGKTDFQTPPGIATRGDFILNAFSNIRYDMRHRGAFRDGHLDALHTYALRLMDPDMDGGYCRRIISGELKRYRSETTSRRRDRRREGYMKGLEDLLEILQHSDIYMMSKVRDDLHDHKKQ